MCQKVERQLVGLAVEVLEQGVIEHLVARSRVHKHGRRGPEFEMVGITERKGVALTWPGFVATRLRHTQLSLELQRPEIWSCEEDRMLTVGGSKPRC